MPPGEQYPLLSLTGHDPAADVHFVASQLIALKAAIAPLLEHPLTAALAAYPTFPDDQLNLVPDAMRHAGIEPPDRSRVAPIGAAAAATGLGLCAHYSEPDLCEFEETQMNTTRVLGIEYTPTALAVTYSSFQASRKGYDWRTDRAWDLGSDATMNDGDDAVEEYWKRVRVELQDMIRALKGRSRVTHVMLMGDSVLDERFLQIMEDALHNVLDTNVMLRTSSDFSSELKKTSVDPIFAVAIGTAEFAKRGMESPSGCVESRICKWWRRQIG